MKKFSWNVNAAEYVPVSQRIVEGGKQENSSTAKGPESKNATVNYHPSKATQDHGDYKNPTSRNYTWKRTDSHGSYASSSKKAIEVSQKELMGEDFDMDLLYLQMICPDLSDDSLSHIYETNGRDLESTVDMLNQLELCANDTAELLPDSLEIGDTSESYYTKESVSLKLKEVADELAASSGSAHKHPVQN